MSSDNPKLYEAIEQGDLETVRALVPNTFSLLDGEKFLYIAVQKNHPHIVEYLARQVAGKAWGNALIFAAEEGFVECVQKLVGYCSDDERAFAAGEAAFIGNLSVVSFLVPLCNARAHESRPLQMACLGNHPTVIEFLYPLSDIDVAAEALEQYYGDSAALGLSFLWELIERKAQHARIHQEINTDDCTLRSRKI